MKVGLSILLWIAVCLLQTSAVTGLVGQALSTDPLSVDSGLRRASTQLLNLNVFPDDSWNNTYLADFVCSNPGLEALAIYASSSTIDLLLTPECISEMPLRTLGLTDMVLPNMNSLPLNLTRLTIFSADCHRKIGIGTFFAIGVY